MTLFADAWHAVARASDVGRPVRRVLTGVPVVLWRSGGAPVAFADLCPHRGAPLSGGRIDGGALVCPYHGYAFDADGACVRVPVAGGPPAPIRARKLPIRESDGLLWTSLGTPDGAPPTLVADGPGWTRLHLVQAFDAPFELVVENFVDSGHTGVLHRGLIRGEGRRVEREVRVERSGRSVLVAHAPVREDVGVLRAFYGDAVTSHTDRFTLPATVEVRYDLGRGRAFAALIQCTPTTDDTTTVHAVVALRLGWLNGPARLALPTLARRVLAQDAEITASVARNLRENGASPGFAPSDAMHRMIHELIAAARAGDPLPPDEAVTLRMWL